MRHTDDPDTGPGRRPRVAILYHFMYPDDVVSAHHFDGLAKDLAACGWAVEAMPCNRGCRDETQTYATRELHDGVMYRRVWRPRLWQASFAGRLANAVWMVLAWMRLALRGRARRPDVVIVGTDPVFAVAVAIPLKFIAPEIRVAHWCFDMHPEASVASGMLNADSLPVRLVRSVMRRAYSHCDLIADLGPCMRRRLRRYGHNAAEVELTPWALAEPARPAEVDAYTRQELFGKARLGLLYSGNFGEAHSFEELLSVARALRDTPEIHFCFAVRGNCADALRAAVTDDDYNISFAGFAPIEDLEKRLGAADIHLASLRPEWSGIAVPSKFFGSLAAGRPVVFAGSEDSAIAEWIRRHGVGWHLAPETREAVADALRGLAECENAVHEMQERCHRVYLDHFAREEMTSRWDVKLRALLPDASINQVRT